MDEAVRKIAALGLPGVILLIAAVKQEDFLLS